MSVDTKELRAIAAGLDRPIGAEILRAAADEIDELRRIIAGEQGRADGLAKRIIAGETAAHEQTKRELDELRQARRADYERLQEIIRDKDAELSELRARLKEAEAAIRAVNSADHGLECTIDHDSEAGNRLCPKRICRDYFARHGGKP